MGAFYINGISSSVSSTIHSTKMKQATNEVSEDLRLFV